MSIWALFVLGLLWVKLQWMFSYRSFCRHFLLVKYLGFKLLDPLPDIFLKRLYHFTLFQTKVFVWPMMSSASTCTYQPFAYLLWLGLLVFLLLNCRGSLYVMAAVSPSLWLPFNFLEDVFWRTENFNFQIQSCQWFLSWLLLCFKKPVSTPKLRRYSNMFSSKSFTFWSVVFWCILS